MAMANAILRRWISTSRALSSSSRGISLYLRNSSDANRLMSTNSSEPPRLMLPPTIDGSGNIAYRFHSLANKEDLTHTNKSDKLQLPADINDVAFVGSSHGWLAVYNRRNSDLFLSNPIADRHIKLPPLHTLGAADRVILSSALSLSSGDDDREEEEEEEEEEEPIAFMISGSRRRVAFCSPRRSQEWTLLGGGDGDRDLEYENVAYSSRHKRLFCISKEGLEGEKRVLECWDVDHKRQSLERQYEHITWNTITMSVPRPSLSEFKTQCSQIRYIVCAQHSGEVFLVVRHVNPRAGPLGSLLDSIILSRDRGCLYTRTPYKTTDFDVFKIDVERRAVVYLEDSLEGLAMFVGINHPFAIPAAAGVGVDANSVYFTDENSLVRPTRLERVSYGGHDNGIFDYQHRDFHPCCDFYPIEYDRIRKILPLPLWFTPSNHSHKPKYSTIHFSNSLY